MTNPIPDRDLVAIEEAIRNYPAGASAHQILDALPQRLALGTLQHRLKYLRTHDRIVKQGAGRRTIYRLPVSTLHGQETASPVRSTADDPPSPLRPASLTIQEYVRRSPLLRRPIGYNRDFLDLYYPNASPYLSDKERAHLLKVGRPRIAEQPAGTYAKHILNRLLIDLAWNSSRLEGNTYSLLDTKRLIEFGEEAEGHEYLETQMILNHKDAIEFLVSTAEEIGFDRYTILNLHGLLANNLSSRNDIFLGSGCRQRPLRGKLTLGEQLVRLVTATGRRRFKGRASATIR